MARTEPTVTYRKLPSQGASLLGRSRLYAGPDHLLHAEAAGFIETYKRFYFKDIQAFVVVRTGYWSFEHVALGLCAVACLTLGAAFAASGDPGLEWATAVLGLVGLACVVGLVLSLLAGPRCRCAIRTAVQTERLRALSRYRRSVRLIESLRPLIEQAQGHLAGAANAPATPAVTEPARPVGEQPAPGASGASETGADSPGS